MGRALLAGSDVKGARQQFELAASAGYRAARIDLGNLLVDGSVVMPDPDRAVLLYEQAWQAGVPIAAFELGHLYEAGVSVTNVGQPHKFQPDLAKAWSWYQKGADASEPHALARFAERDESDALGESDSQTRHALLAAFSLYAAAAERAHYEDWPEDAWRNWRYRRATLARLLAREDRMSEVAQLYDRVHHQPVARPPMLGQRVSSFMPSD
jgi:TPR repeat protein